MAETKAAFKDYFSAQAGGYAAHRPQYPPALFDFLAGVAPDRRAAWDCATGSGQAAVGLAERVDRVLATDASEEQLRHAVPHPRVTYRVGSAEDPDGSDVPDASFDLVTVAQALHWFDRPRFYAQVRRALRPRGVLAVWCYGLMSVSPEVDRIVHAFYDGEVGPNWPPERRLVDEGYRSIELPFEELAAPELFNESQWNLAALVGYLGTWSAVHRFIAATGKDPLPGVRDELAAVWGDPEVPRAVRWPLHLRLGRV